MEEGFGYKNWGQGLDDDASYDTSTPPTYTSENYGFGAGTRKRASTSGAEDLYNFDYDKAAGKTKTRYQGDAVRASNDSAGRPTRRMSTADRTKQILESVQRSKPSKDDSEVFTSFQDSWNELMQDLESVPGSVAVSPNAASPLTPGGSDYLGTPAKRPQPDKNSPFFSPNGSDSFEISAADLEVGSIAARRSKEKAQERRRVRQSFDPDHMPPQMSPQTTPNRNSPSPRFKSSALGVQESTALSSIDKTDAVKLGGTDGKLYGAVDKSDGDLFKMLTENRIKGSEYARAKSGSFDSTGLPAGGPETKRSRSDEGATGSKAPMQLNNPSTRANIDRGNDDSAEYSDEFDEDFDSGSIEKKENATTKKADLAAPIKVSDSVEEAIVRNALANTAAAAESKPAPILSSKEMERRKSMAEIQQRWFSPSPPVLSSNSSAPEATAAPSTSPHTVDATDKPVTIEVVNSIAEFENTVQANEVSPRSMPFTSDATSTVISNQVIRPSPLVTSSVTRLASIPETPPQIENAFIPSVGGSFSIKPINSDHLDEEFDNQTNAVNVTADTSKSDPPSPPSSAAPSAAASLDGPQLRPSPAVSILPPAVSNSLGSVFRKMSVESDTSDHDELARRARVSFDLNKNENFGVPENDPSRRSAAMSVDSLDNTFNNKPDMRDKDRLFNNDNMSSRKSNAEDAKFRHDYENFMASQSTIKHTGNSRYSPNILDEASSCYSHWHNGYNNCDIKANNNSNRNYATPAASSMANLRCNDMGSTTNKFAPKEEKKELTSIPLTLDVVVPSIDELHAQLAMIKVAEKRRREHRVDRSSERGSWETGRLKSKASRQRGNGSVTTGAVVGPSDHSQSQSHSLVQLNKCGRSISPPPPPFPAAAPEWDSLSRLEQSNSRLNRQFENLSHEIKLLRDSTATSTTPPRMPRPKSNRDPVYDSQRLEGGIAVERQMNSGWRQLQVDSTPHEATVRPYKPDGSKIGAIESWDSDALSAVKDILKESEDLRKKEKTFHEREKILNIRENLINQASVSKIKEKNPAHDTQKDSMMDEIVLLKSQLFQAQQHIFHLHSAAKAVVGGDDFESATESSTRPAWDSTHYFELTCTYLTRLGHDPRSVHKNNVHIPRTQAKDATPVVVEDADNADGLGGKWINGDYFIPHSMYLKLQRDKLASESILEASQKENERLMGVLKMQEKDIRTKDAIFFDQQSDLVKEINKLRNQLQSFSGAPSPATENQAFGDGLLPGFQISGIGGMGRNESVSTGGRKAFEAEAIIWRLQEQLAEAENCAKERENKLQQTIGRLTLDNERLNRNVGGSEMNNATARPLILKSEVHKTYYSGQLVGASAGWLDVEIPPPPPPEDQQSNLDQIKTSDNPSPQDMAVSELQVVLRDERKQHQAELELLRSRLKWFAETQQVIDNITDERDQLAYQLKSGDNSPIKARVRGGESSFSSIGSYRRLPSDIKKIKEMESTIHELRDALQKRFPDSISNLLYSTSAAGVGADPAELERARQEVSQLREQIDELSIASDRKLRGLRQEFEKMRVVYEDKIRNLEGTNSAAPNKGKLSISAAAIARRAANTALDQYGKPWSSNNLIPAKNLSQALARIRELELAESRLRSFYTKKIEEIQRRYENQIHSLKRNGQAGSSISYAHQQNPVPADTKRGNAEDITLESDEKEYSLCSDSSENATATNMLHVAEKRLTLLQDELLKTAEELGISKKRIISLEEALKQHNIVGEPSLLVIGGGRITSPPLSTNDTTGSRDSNEIIMHLQQQISMLQHQVQDYRNVQASPLGNSTHHLQFDSIIREKDMLIIQLGDRETALQKRLDETLEMLHKETLSQVRAREEWSEIQKRLIDKIEGLQNETMNQRDQMRALQATPEMHNFLALESHLNRLEAKLAHRNQELNRALEDGKQSMQLERIRLQAFHEQELREKDEQLKGFQVELEHLISAMRIGEKEKSSRTMSAITEPITHSQ